jgi:hypothetical protein
MHSLFRVSDSVDLLKKAGKIKFVLGLVWKAAARFALCHLES